MTLHLISSTNKELLLSCLAASDTKDCIVLIADGVYLSVLPEFQTKKLPGDIFYIAADAQSLGIQPPENFRPISSAQLVELSEQQSNSLTWY